MYYQGVIFMVYEERWREGDSDAGEGVRGVDRQADSRDLTEVVRRLEYDLGWG